MLAIDAHNKNSSGNKTTKWNNSVDVCKGEERLCANMLLYTLHCVAVDVLYNNTCML